MPTITFIHPDGTRQAVEASIGASVMRAAVGHGITEIIAECGGACACATCQCYVDPAWAEAIEPAGPLEISMTDDMDKTRPHLRLSCQLKVTSALDGLVIHIPASQR